MNIGTNDKKLKQRESFKRLINICLSAICLGLEAGAFAYHWMNDFRYSVQLTDRVLWFKGNMLEITIYASILFMLSSMYGGMRLGYLKNAEIIFSQVFATVLADVLIYAELSVMAFRLLEPEAFISMAMEQTLIIIIYINLANRFYRYIFPPRRLLLIHGDRPIDGIRSKFESRADKYLITRTIHIKEGYEAISRAILESYETDECNAVVIGDISVAERTPLIKLCYGQSIRVYLLPKITDVIMMGAEELHVFDSPMLLTREYSLSVEQRIIKRCIDVVFSLILLLITSPFMLLTAIAIKLYDGGPVLYRQVRCTRNQRQFYIMKFRSMRTDAEKDGVARLASKHDDRITPIGKVIRKCRIDELPQLLNILKGDMSFIGPRPERPEIIAQYMEVMPEFVYRTKVKAGLAGFAQVYGKYNTTPYDKLKLDLTYIENYSVWLDVKLMLLTLKVLFWPDSTEGIEGEQITALREEKQRQSGSEQKDEE